MQFGSCTNYQQKMQGCMSQLIDQNDYNQRPVGIIAEALYDDFTNLLMHQ